MDQVGVHEDMRASEELASGKHYADRSKPAAASPSITLDEGIMLIPARLRDKLQERLRGNFREVIRYERTHKPEADAVALDIPDESELTLGDDDESEDA